MARSPIMILDKLPAIAGMGIEDKWTLAVELWDELSEHQQELPMNQAILDVVGQRFADYERDPSTAITLEEFKRRFRLP
jgi:putative addiction module component (TIGR02574 family)